MIIFDLYTYFNLLGELSCRIDNKNDAEPLSQGLLFTLREAFLRDERK